MRDERLYSVLAPKPVSKLGIPHCRPDFRHPSPAGIDDRGAGCVGDQIVDVSLILVADSYGEFISAAPIGPVVAFAQWFAGRVRDRIRKLEILVNYVYCSRSRRLVG